MECVHLLHSIFVIAPSTYAKICPHSCMHTCTHTHMHTYHTCTHTHVHIQTCNIHNPWQLIILFIMTNYAAAENKAVHLAIYHARLEFSLE